MTATCSSRMCGALAYDANLPVCGVTSSPHWTGPHLAREQTTGELWHKSLWCRHCLRRKLLLRRRKIAISVILLGPSKQILASEKVSDLLPHIRGGGADIEGGIRWGLLRLRLQRCQMSPQIYAGRFGEVCSEPHERLLIVIEGSHVGFGGNMGQSIPGYGRPGGGCDPIPNVTSPSLRSRCATTSFDHLVGAGEQRSRSRLVATASEDRLSFRRNSHTATEQSSRASSAKRQTWRGSRFGETCTSMPVGTARRGAASHGLLWVCDRLDSQRMRHLCDFFRWIVAGIASIPVSQIRG